MNIDQLYLPISGGLPGVDSATLDLVGILKAVGFGPGALILGAVENTGTANLSLTLKESDDNNLNGTGDAYATMNFQVRSGAGMTTATSITVVPGGRTPFVIALNQTTQQVRFLKFLASLKARGMVTLCHAARGAELRENNKETYPA